jgi:hypothetical protein
MSSADGIYCFIKWEDEYIPRFNRKNEVSVGKQIVKIALRTISDDKFSKIIILGNGSQKSYQYVETSNTVLPEVSG